MKQRYDSYKPSGIDWIGDIPSHWELRRMRYLCDIITGDKDTVNRVDDGLYPFYVRSPQIERINSYSFDGEAVLMAGDGVGAGKVLHYATGKFDFHQRVYNFHNFREIKGKLLYQYLKSLFKYKIEEGGAKNTVDSVRQPWLKDFPVCIPPLAEQEAIAAWLDEKCGEIDAAITKVDREIELIDELKQSEISRVVTRGLNPDAPLRPSGIDWIGDIPKHWKMCRFKNFMYLKTTPSVSDIKVGLENLESGSGKFIESDTEFEGNGVEFCTNNILYGKLRPYLKKVWLAEFSGNAIGDFFVFSNCPNSNASYLKYVLLSDGFTKQADGSTFGAKMPRVSSEFILTLPFYLPPLAEQQAIADYLDKKCAEIDGLKAKLNRKRETLTELRQSIISEVVTGKRKVI